MADPEQIHAEVLSEEQAKGVSASVAEGRAKAARARAEAGSPHPKEAKWWPGAQPHLDGGGGEAPAEAEEAVEEPAQEAAEETAEPAAKDEPAEAPVAEAAAKDEPAEAPVAEAAAKDEPAEAPVAEAPPDAKPSGVIHGTATGTRLRPEDASTTQAQFEGQAAMYERRKLIDELVATGVPAVSAIDTGAKRSPALALLYLLIPIIAIAFLLAQNDSGPAEPPPPPDGGDGGITVTAASVQFDTDQLTLPADTEATVHFVNDDAVDHNIAIYEDDSASKSLFKGAIIGGGSSVDYDIPALEKGEFYFQCDVHSSMSGSVTVE